MKNIRIADATLCRNAAAFSFKEKIEVARLLERLQVDTVELPAVTDTKTDMLLLRTLTSFVKQAELSVAVGLSADAIAPIMDALSGASRPVLRIELPTSPVGMEYTCHLKAPKMLARIEALVTAAKAVCSEVEFCALDATRAEKDFLKEAVRTAAKCGATRISVCDDAAVLLPDAFAAFVADIRNDTCPELAFGVVCGNRNGMANAAAVLAMRDSAETVKTAVSDDTVNLESLMAFMKDHPTDYGCAVRLTELSRTTRQIERICGKNAAESSRMAAEENTVKLDANDTREAVESAITTLGYDLSEEDLTRVYEEFKRIAAKKTVGARELDAIVATAALQVPQTYTLINYIVNSGNLTPASAQIRLSENGVETDGIALGDGPIDAAFRAIEQLIGNHYDLEDFQIQTVTEGREAMGSAIVKLRFAGKIYSGNGISTDIIGASIRAYLGAVNKIVYEEA